MARRGVRSISVPITFGAVTVPLSAALLVGWTMFTARNIAERGAVAENVWLLVLGVLSFIVIMSVLVMFSIFLAREIIEVRRQDSFIDSVTHELKTPLASIKLCLQTLERDGLPEDKRAALRTMMHDDVDRLATFIDDVLQASRLAHDDASMHHDEVAMAALVESIADSVAQRHKIERATIRVDVPADLRLVTDRAAMDIVVRNLLDNAVKYSPRPPDIEVTTSVHPRTGAVSIHVRDRGIGIPKADLKRIFQRFYRVEDESVRARKGTGLGLFVVSALVRNLGGEVGATSDGPGAGATLTLTLPHGGAEGRRDARKRARATEHEPREAV